MVRMAQAVVALVVAAGFVASVLPLSPRRLRPPERLEAEVVAAP